MLDGVARRKQAARVSRSILLGKNGDILSILPCLQTEFKETGKKPTLIVAKEYAQLANALPWLSVEEYPDDFERLGEAIKWAKLRGKVDFMPQMSGVGYPTQARKHPSFQYDQWHRMGRLCDWGKLTLELPRTGNLSIPEKPFILLADHSQSSPFPHRDDLFESLAKEFPEHQIVRLSSIKAPHLFDFLALFDASGLLVSIDTSFAHLSMASKVPFIMLATDVPGTWWGSAYHPRMSLHVRYSDYFLRKSELLHVARKVVKNKA